MSRIHLEIDGREVEVPRGSTVLEAARRLGIEIPTLCHVPGVEAAASCFVCAVQIAGRSTLSPACALPAAEGMRVETETEDLRATRRVALELLLSDHAGECAAPCAVRCPAGLDIPGHLGALADRDTGRANQVLHDTLALPGALGRICPRLCESGCRRAGHGGGLAIAALHRHAAEANLASAEPVRPPRRPPSGRSVAIVGAGPAGLAAARDLSVHGHRVTIYEARSEAGGMLRWAIPAYRLPRAALAAEIAHLLGSHIELRTGQVWGSDFSLSDLRRHHEAIFVAVGAGLSRALSCRGAELALPALQLLARVAAGERPRLGERVLVVGGGNTAVDAARTARRLGSRVEILYRRARAQMPCLDEEVEEAEAEGVELRLLVAPSELCRRPDGRLEVRCREMELGEPDATGRRRPVPKPDGEQVLLCDTVIAAVGQEVELGPAKRDGLGVRSGRIEVDPRTLATARPGVFAGGDAVLGADLAVRAVAAGRLAAVSIDQYLRREPVLGRARSVRVALEPLDEEELAVILRGIERAPRAATRRLPVEDRLAGFDEVDGGLPPALVEAEARRCMSCGCRRSGDCRLRGLATALNARPDRFPGLRRRAGRDESHAEVVYEPGKCIACGACVQVAAGRGEELGLTLVGRGFGVAVGVPWGEPLAKGLTRSAAECVAVCPTGALALRTAGACGPGCDRLVLLGGR